MKPYTIFKEREILRLSFTPGTLGFLLLALQLTSCVSYKSITEAGATTNLLKTSTAIVPGNVLRITMKNGEEIKKLKVKEIDSLKISGVQTIETYNEKLFVNKTIMVAQAMEIKKRKFSPIKTAGVVFVSLVPVLILASIWHPCLGCGVP